MDEVARYNFERWQAMVRNKAVFTRPYLDLTPADAREAVDPLGQVGEVAGKDVLCLAGGGPREYKHTLGTLVNGLLAAGFVLQHRLEEPLGCDDTAAPGTTDHLWAVAPPWLGFWARKRQAK